MHHSFYLDFMQHVHDAKSKPGFTNLEQNILVALHCCGTMTEVCAAALYCECVEKPYTARVRGGDSSGKQENLLDLGPLHADIVMFCSRVADNPDLVLLSSSSEGRTGLPTAFNGEAIDRPDVFYAVQARANTLPQLKNIIGAFFCAARVKWEGFSQEYQVNGTIAKMTPVQRHAAFLSTTNDVNEGALGLLRVVLRRAPNLSLQGYNARMLLKRNNVVGYIESLPLEQRAWARKFARSEARLLTTGDHERKRRLRLAEFKAEKAKKNAQKAKELAEKHARQDARLAQQMQGIELELNEHVIELMSGAALQCQIECHRRLGVIDPVTRKNVAVGASKLRVHEKKAMLYGLIRRHKAAQNNTEQDKNSNTSMVG